MTQVRAFTSAVLDPFERGVEFGQRHADQIAHTIATYGQAFAARAIGPFDTELWSLRAWEAIRTLSPWAAQEIRGMSQGAGVPVSGIAALNARTELLSIANPAGTLECSSVVALPEGRPPVACQTWDWYEAFADSWLIWTIPFPDGHVLTTLTEYGVLGKIGASSSGVGVLFNRLLHARDASVDIGYPLHLLSRRILEKARNTGDAVKMAREVEVSTSSSITVVDRSGSAASLELYPGGVGVVEPEHGLLVRTNHFVTPEGRPGCLAGALGPGSEIRRETLRSSLASKPPQSAQQVLDAMHDHDEVGGICRHPDLSLEPVLQHATLATVTVDVIEQSVVATPGGPCSRRSHELTATTP